MYFTLSEAGPPATPMEVATPSPFSCTRAWTAPPGLMASSKLMRSGVVQVQERHGVDPETGEALGCRTEHLLTIDPSGCRIPADFGGHRHPVPGASTVEGFGQALFDLSGAAVGAGVDQRERPGESIVEGDGRLLVGNPVLMGLRHIPHSRCTDPDHRRRQAGATEGTSFDRHPFTPPVARPVCQ
jgi:hypothetical protein